MGLEILDISLRSHSQVVPSIILAGKITNPDGSNFSVKQPTPLSMYGHLIAHFAYPVL